MKNKDFAIFILTHGRSDRVFTYKTLKKLKFKGKIYFICDDEDQELENYQKKFGVENVLVFSKKEIAKEFDVMDNFDDYRAVVYARNACFKLAESVGVKYFMMLDDDYKNFYYRYNDELKYKSTRIRSLDKILDSMIDFFKRTNIKSIAMAQEGDFLGGAESGIFDSITRRRKCMNSFICSTDRPFNFIGRINEDVNTYVGNAKFGDIFLTVPIISVAQLETQSNPGGLTEIYLNLGTYVKSFYSVMVSPSSVKVAPMGQSHKRIHHRVSGITSYPMIINEKFKK